MSPWAMLVQLFGMPMLSISVSISSAGITLADFAFDRGEPQLRSLRCACRPEPRACSRIWPESTLGKKSSPTSQTKPSEAMEIRHERRQDAAAMPQRPISRPM